MVERLIAAGHWQAGDPEIWIVANTATTWPGWRTSWPICPRGGRAGALGPVFRFPAVHAYDPRGGRPPKHGAEFALARPDIWPEGTHTTVTETERYGAARALA